MPQTTLPGPPKGGAFDEQTMSSSLEFLKRHKRDACGSGKVFSCLA